jgi:hypothetical protein
MFITWGTVSIGFAATMDFEGPQPRTIFGEEFGGSNDFAVNDWELFQIIPLTDLPEEVAPGVTASVEDGVITPAALDGNIDNVLIGGQQLAVDNIAALPEPTPSSSSPSAAFCCSGDGRPRKDLAGSFRAPHEPGAIERSHVPSWARPWPSL